MKTNKSILITAFIFLVSITTLLVSCSKYDDETDEMIPIPTTVTFEENLSSYNIYNGELKNLVPSTDFHLFELNSSLFSNYAKKQRLVKLPTGTQMTEDGNGIPVFPNGTILVKTFYYFVDERDETLGKKIIETRLLIKGEDFWNVASYVWNENQTDATLYLNGFDTQVSWTNSLGNSRSIAYSVPDQNQCVACHQQKSEVLPIGPTLRNLNIDVTKNNLTQNQLEYFHSIDILNNLNGSQINKIPDYNEGAVTLAEKGRAYLDMNCAHCHNPSGWSEPANKGYDFRFETDINSTGILNNKDRIKKVTQNGEMPYFGTTVIDEEGIELIVEYLNNL